jgi:hypothetical protein
MVKHPGLPFLSPEIRELQVSDNDPAQLLRTFHFVQFFGKRHEGALGLVQKGELERKTELWYRKICMLLYTYCIGCLYRR